MFSINDYDYPLPEHLIAQHPVAGRDRSRLLVVDRRSGRLQHRRFDALTELLSPGDVLVVNNTEVVPARLYGRKATGGRVEVLILDYTEGLKRYRTAGRFVSPCLIRASKRPRVGSRIRFDSDFHAEVIDSCEDLHTLRFECTGDVEAAISRMGCPPLPPYIRRDPDSPERRRDVDNYQTVYACVKGAIAAPTAGLHFTAPLLEELRAAGIEVATVTLHVGYGTFLPVRVDDIREHRMHGERFDLPPETVAAVDRARDAGRRVVAVGTTSVRTLENAVDPNGRLTAGRGENHLFIYPGYEFRAVDAMITNFHLPKSTLLMLVSAFAGMETIRSAYAEAIRNEYRFFSYGDAMLIL
ncbi:MAG: tRNA preQ1(34) S-adenosylmethionine ribosyltransferase-isomerase QueA [Desulfobacterales bacterium]